MNPGLRYLLAKGPVIVWRRLRRRFRGPGGIVGLIGITLLVVLIVAPQFVVTAVDRNPERLAAIADTIRLAGPLALLLFVLASAMRGGIWFRPAEIQFLFPAPIGRRELLIYDALSKLRVQLLSALWLGVFTLRYAQSWYAAFLAMFLALAFLQLAGQAIGLSLSAFEERFGRRLRRFCVLAVWGLIGIGVVRALGTGGGFTAVLAEIAAWPPVAVLSWLTRPPVEVFLADAPATLALWSAATLAVLLLLIGLMLWLDVAYAEGALERAQKVQRALARMRSGGGAFAAAAPGGRGLRVPALPYWRGVGPIAWRQLQELARNYRAALMMGAMMLVFVGMFAFLPRFAASNNGPGGPPPVFLALIMMTVMAPMLVTNSAFDFRRDLDRMALLKSLPLSGFALALGQILPTALLVTAWELIAAAALAVWTRELAASLFVALVLVAPPLNAVLLALDNILFLKLPYRVVASDPGRVPFMPRLMLVMFLKMFLLLVLLGVTALPGALAWYLSGSILVTAAAVAVFLVACCIPMVFIVAWAFGSFDVSRDIPD